MRSHSKKHVVSALLSVLLVFTCLFGSAFVYAESIESQNDPVVDDAQLSADDPVQDLIEATQEPTVQPLPSDEPALEASATEEPLETSEAEEPQEATEADEIQEPVDVVDATESATLEPAKETPLPEVATETETAPQESAEVTENEEELPANDTAQVGPAANETDNITGDGDWVTEDGVKGVRIVTGNVPDDYSVEVVFYLNGLDNEVQRTPVEKNTSVFVPNQNGGTSCTIYILDATGTTVKGFSFTPGIIIGDYGINLKVVNCKTVEFAVWGYAARVGTGRLMVRPAGTEEPFVLHQEFAIGQRVVDGYPENYY